MSTSPIDRRTYTRAEILELMAPRPAPPKPKPAERPWTLDDVFGRRPERKAERAR